MARPPSRTDPPLLALKEASLSFGDLELFRDLDIAIGAGDRICLVGRNGSGKTTLMRTLAGEIELDRGERFVQPGARIGFLPQVPRFPAGRTVAEHVLTGLEDRNEAHRVEPVLDRLALDGARALGTLSGGESRRAAIAHALVSRPDLLLMDEPTNHLDLPTIAWLEDELSRFAGGLLLVSHDRAFLRALSNRTIWIDRGTVRRNPAGFAAFADWSARVLAEEEMQQARLGHRIAAETRWLREGLTARRRRNMGRKRALEAMRGERARLAAQQRREVRFSLAETERSGDVVLEARGIEKATPDGRTLIRPFSTMVKRGARIGVLGRNGIGKTTLLRLLIGEDRPDRGHVRTGFGVVPVYFDQKRESLDPDQTVRATLCPGGGDTVEVAGRSLHVMSYLRDFLFDPRQAAGPVSALSGGERNRLLLARLFSRRHNLLVLDEPTNDLDVETLELLEEVLGEYDGTILLVSHDRDFLDSVATSVLLFGEDGRITEHAGGFSGELALPAADATPRGPRRTGRAQPAARRGPSRRLGYREQRELDQLPDRIEGLAGELAELRARLADTELYRRNPALFELTTARFAEATTELEQAEERWVELETRREELADAG